MNGMETLYTICVLILSIAAAEGLGKLKRFLKQYSRTCQADGSVG